MAVPAALPVAMWLDLSFSGALDSARRILYSGTNIV